MCEVITIYNYFWVIHLIHTYKVWYISLVIPYFFSLSIPNLFPTTLPILESYFTLKITRTRELGKRFPAENALPSVTLIHNYIIDSVMERERETNSKNSRSWKNDGKEVWGTNREIGKNQDEPGTNHPHVLAIFAISLHSLSLLHVIFSILVTALYLTYLNKELCTICSHYWREG